jgi:hypothetical protein
MHVQSPKMGYTYKNKSRLIEPVSNAALLVRGFSLKLGFFANFIYVITLAGRQIVRLLRGMKSGAAKMQRGQGGRAALRLSINEPKKTGARRAAETHWYVSYAFGLDISSLLIFESYAITELLRKKCCAIKFRPIRLE